MSSNGSDKANAIAAIDLLLNLLMLFVVVSAIALVQMNPPAQARSAELKAELVLELTWADQSFADLDLWLMLPDGRKVSYAAKDAGVATLDRDDRGGFGDLYAGVQGEAKLISINKETTVVRAIVPGRYVVNVHYYHHYDENEIGMRELAATPDPVRVKLTKLNPQLVEVADRTLSLGRIGSQRTAFCFDVEASGAVSQVDLQCDVPILGDTGGSVRQGT
ncbi:MAG TPA: hypothetical protein VHL79_02260 [Ramlibacter sp.]|jgi:hypothetical protein|nr:hypothetical protein [Ramlibacter sp.]